MTATANRVVSVAGQALSRERIVEVAIDLADREGLDSVSMRRIAKQLGAGAMSLYRHVADKEELLRGMIDTLHSRHAYPDPGDLGWRERMRLLARHDWDMYTAHPWLLTATATLAPPAGPHMLASMEWALTALEPLELTPEQAGRAIMAVTHHLQGSARLALGGEGDLDERSPGNAWRRRLGGEDLSSFPRVAALVGTAPEAEEGHPGVGSAVSEGAEGLGSRGGDWVLSGLDMVLDGIAAQSEASQF